MVKVIFYEKTHMDAFTTVHTLQESITKRKPKHAQFDSHANTKMT